MNAATAEEEAQAHEEECLMKMDNIRASKATKGQQRAIFARSKETRAVSEVETKLRLPVSRYVVASLIY